MNHEIIPILAIPIVIFVVIELSIYLIVKFVNKEFPWLIINKDEKPILPIDGLKKFIPLGYDAELGWVRKPNTEHNEHGKNGAIKWSINSNGSRTNPGFDDCESKISCYGDSFTFSRQVSDDETWEHYLSKMKQTNVQNFGVGNYGLDQAILRLKREFPHHKTDTVILAVVPDTISRILSVWKHYYEYGNTFGFKPRFILKNNNLELIPNPINEENQFQNYNEKLDQIQKYDYFYKNKFKKEIIHFPYSLTILKHIKRNFGIIYWILKIHHAKKSGTNTPKLAWKPMNIIMNINLSWRVKLYQDKSITLLLHSLIKEFVDYANNNNFNPVFMFLPQKDDLLYIKKNYNFYQPFIDEINKISDLKIIDVTNNFLQESNLDLLYSDSNNYGGHYSPTGNRKIADIISANLK